MFDWKKLLLINLIILNIALAILGFGGLFYPKTTLANPPQPDILAQNRIQKWDYWRIKLRTNALEEDWKTVLETGKNGWEMVNCDGEENEMYIMCFFKRPI